MTTPDLVGLEKYPHISRAIQLMWGTVELSHYFTKLFSDTRNETRIGFPANISALLIKLSNENEEILKDRGLDFDDYASNFTPVAWQLPKNF